MQKIQLSDKFNYKKIMKFTMPSVIMMVVMSIYSVVDGFVCIQFDRGYGAFRCQRRYASRYDNRSVRTNDGFGRQRVGFQDVGRGRR